MVAFNIGRGSNMLDGNVFSRLQARMLRESSRMVEAKLECVVGLERVGTVGVGFCRCNRTLSLVVVQVFAMTMDKLLVVMLLGWIGLEDELPVVEI